MHIDIPEDVQFILKKLGRAGYEAYIVGGCTRDSILGTLPQDWDITTCAMPEQVKQLFPRTIDTGIKHGTVTVMIGVNGYEVTTYRVDGVYEDSRHPRDVTFTRSLEEDLKRRDFTINAMAYNPEKGLVDLFGGIQDLEKGRIRCVGDPRARFSEDALRMMRAVRFAAQLGFVIEEDTACAVKELAGNLVRISAERIRSELEKLLISPHPELIEAAYRLGITGTVLPEYDALTGLMAIPAGMYENARKHTAALLPETAETKQQRFAALMAYMDPEQVEIIMRRLKFDNSTRILTERLVRFQSFAFENTEADMRRFLYETGEDLFPELVRMRAAQIAAGEPGEAAAARRDLKEKKELFRKVTESGQCFSLDKLAVSGNDLIAAGVKPGRKLGVLLHKLLEEVIKDQNLNEKDRLIRMALEQSEHAYK